MTAEEIYESVTNGGSSDFAEAAAILERMGRWCLIGGLGINCYVELEDLVQGKIWAWTDPERRATKRKKDELDLMRIAEAFPRLRLVLPREIVDQIEK